MGRLKQYDEQEVLRKAMLTFWENGYKNTSVRNLEESMGINQFSIYAAFTSKKGLFKRVLQQYQAYLDERYLASLRQEGSSVADIEAFLLNFGHDIATEVIPNGCLMVNTTADGIYGHTDVRAIVLGFFDAMRSLFHKSLSYSINTRQIEPVADLDQSVEYLVGIAQSITIYAKINSPDQIESYIRYAMKRL